MAGVGALVGAFAGGAAGTIYGIGIAAWLSAVVTWWAFRKAFREHNREAAEAAHEREAIADGKK
jgi:hypothetical protein